ncbi:MAG: IS1380 family transposase, partial [bacterium]
MAHNTRYSAAGHPKISAIEETSDNLTSRAGLALFARYLDKIGIAWFIERWLGPIRKNSKGSPAYECMRQILL